MNAIIAWFQSKSPVAHSIAGFAVFLTAAYAGYPPFHAYVQHLITLLPADVEDGLVLIVGLAGFYKTWQRAQNSPKP